MTHQNTTVKETPDSIFVRFPPNSLDLFDVEIKKHGIDKRTEAIKQLVAAWMRNPEALPIGFPRAQK